MSLNIWGQLFKVMGVRKRGEEDNAGRVEWGRRVSAVKEGYQDTKV